MPPQFRFAELANQIETRIRSRKLLDLPADWADDFVYPAYDELSLRNIPHSVAELLDAPLPVASPLDQVVWGNELQASQINRVFVFLSDGLGYLYLQQLAETDPEIGDLVSELTDGRGIVPLTSVAPSTTAVALPALWTGATPAQTGMVSTVTYLREISTLGLMLSFSPVIGRNPPGLFEKWGLDIGKHVPVPGVAEHLKRNGIPTYVVIRKDYSGTGLSRVLHRGIPAQHRATHIENSDLWIRISEMLQATRGEKCYVSVYRSSVDALGHEYGSHSPHVKSEIRNQLRSLRKVISDYKSQDGQTLMIMTADHGHFDALKLINLRDDPKAQPIRDAMLMGLSGDMRLGVLHIREEFRQSVIACIEENFQDCLTYVESSVALDSGLYGNGPKYVETSYRTGDIILIPRLGYQVVDSSVGILNLIGWHGGLSDWEMLTPLLWKVF